MRHQLNILVLGEVSKAVRGGIFQSQALRSAPHYFETSVPHQVILGEENEEIDAHRVNFHLKGYEPDMFLVEATVEVEDIFHEEVFNLEKKIIDRSYEMFKTHGGNEEFSETYSVFTVSDYSGEPEQFLKYGPTIASLLKSEKIPLDSKEIEYTLSAQIKYAKHDLAIIDWDGAFLFDIEGEFDSTIELLTLANLQLLRHRILDRRLDKRLEKIGRMIKKPIKELFFKKNRALAEDLKEIVADRMTSISEFQVLERDVKLIGDWYSARFYDLVAKKFKINEWKEAIKTKLDSLEDVYSIVAENFAISAKSRAEWVQIIAFFILQVGWFALIILEFLYFTK